ncbi:MAG TPA: alpha/beta hydrolase [Candidatus Limnocylindrales bacterium]
MRRRTSTAILAIALGVVGCGSTVPSPAVSPSATPAPTSAPQPTPAPTATPAPSLTTGGLSWLSLSGNESTTVTVPLDYGNPLRGTITLAVVRHRIADPAQRIGTLFLNPGGPGGSGVEMLAGAEGLLPREITDRFDLVSWDPRGVGFSRGVTCPDQATIGKVEALDPTPTTADAIAAYDTAFEQVAAQCQAASGDLLPFLSEANTARDMDAIRAAMGEATISYWGWSYGTYLGYLYASMFPSRLRAAILDGPLDPALDLQGRDDGQARGFQAAFDHEIALCAAAKSCPFYNGGNPGKAFAELMARLDRQPIPAGSGQLGPGEATTGVLAYLYADDANVLMRALAEAQRGDGSSLLGMANAYFAQVQLGSYLATTCIDVAHLPTPAAIAAAFAKTKAVSPDFAGQVVLTDAYGCLDWPVAADPVKVGPPPSGLPPILVLASSHDPATPPFMAQPLASALGTGIVLTRNGLGHTTGGAMRANPCLSDAATAYLLVLTTPAPGSVCTDPPPTFTP